MTGDLEARTEQFKIDRTMMLERSMIDAHQLARELTEISDRLLIGLFPSPTPEGIALVALGSYADYELTPNSDLDIVLLHRPRLSVDAIAQSIWYPLWDLGLKIDNSVRTPKEAVAMAATDPRVLNGLCRPRLITGDPALLNDLDNMLKQTWAKKRKKLLNSLISHATERHEHFGELAYLLEPDLKDAKGGLRDFSIMRSLEYLEDADLLGSGLMGVYDAQKVLQDIRVMLHVRNPRASNRLMLQDQDAVAETLGYRDADQLMGELAHAGKTISFAFDSISRKLLASAKRPATPRISLPANFSVHGDEISLNLPEGIRPTFAMLLRIAVIAGSNNLHISERSLEDFVDANLETPELFSEEENRSFISLLSLGSPMIQVAEALDHFRLFEVIIPEWSHVRCKPQRNAYHTYTVDRHLLESVANAANRRRRVRRPDLLLIAALLHDIGKGYPGDHTEAGMNVIPAICGRLRMSNRDTDTILRLVQNHLTLADTATRRDISDPTTISKVAELLTDPAVVELLEVLTEADSLATGPSAWSSWKAKLVSDLAHRTIQALEGHIPEEDHFPTEEFEALIAKAGNGWAMEPGTDTLKIVAPDKPGLFSLVTGALALVGTDIVAARIQSNGPWALEEFALLPRQKHSTDWNKFAKELQKNFDQPSALNQRLLDKAKNYSRARRRRGVQMVPPRVVIAPDASSRATVVEVWAPDRIGLLHDVTAVIAEMSLSISHAKVLTMGDDVVDSFYLTDAQGEPISDPQLLNDLSAALMNVLGQAEPRA